MIWPTYIAPSVLNVMCHRILMRLDWSSASWRWWMPRDDVSRLQPVLINPQMEWQFVGSTMQQDPFIRWSMLLAIRPSCVVRTVRLATVGTETSVSLLMVPASYDQLPAILATRPNYARHTTQLASALMVQGNIDTLTVNSQFVSIIFYSLKVLSVNLFLLSVSLWAVSQKADDTATLLQLSIYK